MSDNKNNTFDLSVIIPVRMTEARSDIVDRLGYCLSDTKSETPSIEYIVIDDGSSNSMTSRLKQRCKELGLTHIKTNAWPHEPFNLAKARNHAAQHANGSLLLFLDVDLITLPAFYSRIIAEAELLDMEHHVSRFLMCPVIYLTPEGYETFKSLPSHQRESFSINSMLSDNQQIVNRTFYL